MRLNLENEKQLQQVVPDLTLTSTASSVSSMFNDNGDGNGNGQDPTTSTNAKVKSIMGSDETAGEDPLSTTSTATTDMVSANTNDKNNNNNSNNKLAPYYDEEAMLYHDGIGKHGQGGVHRSRWRALCCQRSARCVLLWAFLVSLTVLAVVLLVVLGLQKNPTSAAASTSNSNDSNSTPTSSSPSSPSMPFVVNLPPMPEGLKDACQAGYANPNDNAGLWQTCNDQCALPLKCCVIPPNIPGTCLTEGSEPLCLYYHTACSPLITSASSSSSSSSSYQPQDDYIINTSPDAIAPTNIPLAPDGLEQLCQPNNLITSAGLQACSQSCAEYSCCWADIPASVLFDANNNNQENNFQTCQNDPNCQTYWPCLYLQAHDTVDATIQDYVDQVCGDPNEDNNKLALLQNRTRFYQCRDACKMSRCCFTSTTTTSGDDKYDDCGDKPQGFCEQYSACSVLLEINTTAEAQDDTFLLLLAPNMDKNQDNSINYDDDFLTNDPYDPFHTPKTLPVPELPSDIATVCNPDLVQTDNDAYSACAQACGPSMCCGMDPSVHGSCFAPGDSQILCSQWASYCSALDFVPSAPTGSPNTNGQGGNDDGVRVTQDDTSIDDGGGIFGNYDDGTINVNDDPTNDNNNGDDTIDGGADRTAPPSIPKDFLQVCNVGQVLMVASSFQSCHSYCDVASCCFPTTDSSTSSSSSSGTAQQDGICYAAYPNTCDTYISTCAVLDVVNKEQQQQEPPQLPSDIGDVCNSDLLKNFNNAAYSTCATYCQAASCCLDNLKTGESGACFDAYQTLCSEYLDYCDFLEIDIIDDDATTLTYANTSSTTIGSGTLALPSMSYLAQVCDETLIVEANQSDACVSECQKADCCDIPVNLPGSCLAGNYDTCMAYHKECSVLQVGTGHTDSSFTVPEASTDLATTCSVQNLATSYGLKACREECLVANCCWSNNLDDGESCRDLSNCANYAPCLILSSGAKVDSSITTEIEELCSNVASSTATWAERNACSKACMQHTCCWEKYDGGDTSGQGDTCYKDAVCAQYEACAELMQAG